MNTLSLDIILRARVAALCARHGKALTAVGREMGRSHTWLLKKVDLDKSGLYAVELTDLDAVCAHLGESPLVLLEPVLLEGDADLLRLIDTLNPPTFEGITEHLAQAPAVIQRCERQGLLRRDDHRLALTTLGSTTLARLPSA